MNRTPAAAPPSPTRLATRRRAEGTAAGFNPKRKGARGYHPLLCTIAQTRHVLDVPHRSGNVHDSNGSIAFIRHRAELRRARLPRARIELRADCAFFSEATVRELEELDVAFTLSLNQLCQERLMHFLSAI